MKKKLYALLFSLMFFTASCATADISETPPEFEDVSGTDFAGYECDVLQSTNSSGVINHIEDGNPFGFVATTVFADAAIKRINDIETAINCKINIKTDSAANADLAISAIAGVKLSEVIFSSDILLMNAVGGAGCLYPMSGLEAIDLTDSEKWGGFNIMEINSIKGEIYGVTPMKWALRQPHAVAALSVNRTLTAKYGLFDPKENLENGTWDLDALKRLITEYHVNDGEIEYKSLACRYFDVVKLAVFGNGMNILYIGADGEPQTDIYGQNATDAFAWAKQVWTDCRDSLMFTDASPEWTSVAAAFVAGNAIAALTPTWMIYDTFAQKVDEFSVLPFPTGANGVYGQWPCFLGGADFFAVPVTASDPDAAAYIINMLCEPLDGFETDADVEAYLSRNVLFGEGDAKIMMNLYRTGRYSYWPEGADAFWRSFGYAMDTDSPSEFFEANIGTLQAIIDEYMIPNLAIEQYLSH